ncbi:phosphotransferase family protein [Nonomuraea endophytica]|uniref:phosphotransferase family protein n=1 Tax=Nonomuraea endophytica TaxID=714136 RepID=UPI0037C84F92
MRSTHTIELGPGVVVKRYRSVEHGQPEREWRALGLLDRYAPGMAPAPVSADLDGEPPSVVMSRVAGAPVDEVVQGVLADAVAEAVDRVQRAVPRAVLEKVPARAGDPGALLEQVRGWFGKGREEGTVADGLHQAGANGLHQAGADGLRQAGADGLHQADALHQAGAWLGQPSLAERLARPGTPVFGTGDGNLANYLWDGRRIRLVDFEYAGRSDRAFELAEVLEHISVWRDDESNGMDAVLERLELTAEEAARLTECRRLLALFWLLRTRAAAPAERMLALL